MTKFEECARAIWGETEDDRLEGNYSAVPFEEVWTRGRYTHLRAWLEARTRAVLQALREPDAAMCDAGHDAWVNAADNDTERPYPITAPIWQAMVDAILSEDTP